MKLSLIALAAVALSGAAPAPEASPDNNLDTAIAWCATATVIYRSGEAGKARVAHEMSKLSPDTQKGLAVLCRAYVQGYDDGQRFILKNTA